MMASKSTIRLATKLALSDVALSGALHDWHAHKGRLAAADQRKSFEQWLLEQIQYTDLGVQDIDPCPEVLVKALEICAIGDKLALYLAADAQREHGVDTDTNCYVEEGVVFSNVWLRADNAAWAKIYAEEIADKFNKAGYSAEVWVDEEDDRECTVNAQIDFALYYKANCH